MVMPVNADVVDCHLLPYKGAMSVESDLCRKSLPYTANLVNNKLRLEIAGCQNIVVVFSQFS